MTNLVLHPRTIEIVERYVARPSHAVLLTGPAGLGKGSLLDYIAAKLLGVNDIGDDTRILRVIPETTNSIGIDEIRQIQHFVSLKSVSSGEITRVVRIEDAGQMTSEAQNALLKIIEEPPTDTVLLLSAHSAQQLLPTILSRVQEMAISIPEKAQLSDYLARQGHAREDITRAIAMSGGMPGLTLALLDETSEHPIKQAAEWSRRLLSASKFERLTYIDELAKQRDLSLATCEVMARMASIMLKNPKLDTKQQSTWRTVLAEADAAAAKLARYGQPKLVLDALSLHL